MKAQQGSWSAFDDSYNVLKGVHRIQRAEKSSRRHTSSVIVSIIDEKHAKNIEILDKDIRIDTFRASGPGGQHRNKTDSGVRMLHIPTGTVVTATEDRSQHINRETAKKRLLKKLENVNNQKIHHSINEQRQVADDVAFVWTQWRDEVKRYDGMRTTMKKAMSGKIDKLLQ